MRYCKRCVNPDTRPNIIFDEEGICLPCRFAEEKRQGTVDWAARRAELAEIVAWGKARKQNSYDCIVTVSGGKDSMRQAFHVRDNLGMKPLLVCSMYPPEQMSERGARNLSNLIAHGFDTVTLSLNPQVWKTLVRQGFAKFANWCKSTEMALYAIPVHVAINWQIPLVFYGENPAYTIGERSGGLGGDANGLRNGNTLAGGDPTGLATPDITGQDLHFYRYPQQAEMERAGLRLIFLGYYIEDFNHYHNAEFAIARGLETRNEPPEKIGDLNGNTALDEDFVIVNQMIKYLKLGYGRITDQVTEAIALGRMDRETGVRLVKEYDGKCDPSYIRRYCRYLGITEARFREVVDSMRNPAAWERTSDGQWKLRADITQPAAQPDANMTEQP